MAKTVDATERFLWNPDDIELVNDGEAEPSPAEKLAGTLEALKSGTSTGAKLGWQSRERATPVSTDDLSPKQREAGNYKMRHVRVQGMDISIEHEPGTMRHTVSKHTGNHSYRLMHLPYGYIRGTHGVDGDHVDAFVGPKEDASHVFVVHQVRSDTGAYDEDKPFIGFDNEEEVRDAYLKQYKPTMLGAISTMPVSMFKDRIYSHKGEPVVPEVNGLLKRKSLFVDDVDAVIDEQRQR